jgi:type I restriction enzyme M protein
MAKKKPKPSRRSSLAGRPAVHSLPKAAAESEVEACHYIRERLKEMGWSTKDPNRHAGGEVWTQNQCLSHPEIKKCLGLARPENIVKLSEKQLWVIEAKSKRAMLDQAIREAEDDYARPINDRGRLAVPLISGVAGNDTTGYEVRSFLLVGKNYKPVTINGSPATGLLDRESVRTLLDTGDPNIADLVIDETTFLKAAEGINKTLHNGGINKNDRARVMAALLLSLVEGTGPAVESELPIIIADINARSEALLRKHGKREFFPFVKIEPPTNTENHVKYRAALIQTIQTLNDLNIRSAMNSGADVLGKFYEVFLKYGNGAKEIGIVLTPRHVTRFAVDTIGVGPSDVVYDPACGTGGFLVAAFDHVRRNASKAQIEQFKQHNLFGAEQESAVAALAIVNMIFRGDGKNNIVEANCFSKFLRRKTVNGKPSAAYGNTVPPAGEEGVTRVFMNPPFALKKSDEQEFRFIDTALKSMEDGAILFAIVPLSVMAEGGQHAVWRRDTLLAHHTLLSVVSFPEELFYPVANQTVGLVVRKGTAHPPAAPVLWARVVNDGFRKSKGRRLPAPPGAPNDLDRLVPILRAFLANPGAPVATEPEFVKAGPIDYTDPILELVPEAYLPSVVPTPQSLWDRLDKQVRENIAAFVRVDLDLGTNGTQNILDDAAAMPRGKGFHSPKSVPKMQPVRLDSMFELFAGHYHSLSDLDPGVTPVISCGTGDNGVVGCFSVEDESKYAHALTIAFNGRPLTTKMHPYEFASKDDVAVAFPPATIPASALVFVQAALNAETWRFSYYRKCFREKLGRTVVTLPVKADGKPDFAFMQSAVEAQPYWWFLSPRLTTWAPTKAADAEDDSID